MNPVEDTARQPTERQEALSQRLLEVLAEAQDREWPNLDPEVRRFRYNNDPPKNHDWSYYELVLRYSPVLKAGIDFLIKDYPEIAATTDPDVLNGDPVMTTFMSFFVQISDWLQVQHLGRIDPELKRRELRLRAWLVYHFLRLSQTRAPTFELSPTLVTALVGTQPDGISPNDLRSPFQHFIIKLPKNNSFKIFNVEDGQYHPVSSIMVADVETALNNRGVKSRTVFFYVYGQPLADNIGPYDDAILYFLCDLGFDSLAKSFEDLIPNARQQVRDVGSDTDTIVEIARFVFNAMLYISMPKADVEKQTYPALDRVIEQLRKYPKGGKRQKLLDKKKSLEQQRGNIERYRVGSHIILNPLVSAAIEAHADDVRSRKLTKVRYTKGHYNTYWVGEGRAEKMVKWVMPYITMPAGAVMQTEEPQKYRVRP